MDVFMVEELLGEMFLIRPILNVITHLDILALTYPGVQSLHNYEFIIYTIMNAYMKPRVGWGVNRECEYPKLRCKRCSQLWL